MTVRSSALVRSATLALAVFALLLCGAIRPAAAKVMTGEKVTVTGVVSDPQGNPVKDVAVVLEISRRAFSLRSFGRDTTDLTRVAVGTSATGEYALQWTADSYYNHFELVVGVQVRRAGGRVEMQELQRTDISRRMAHSPVVVPVTIADTRYVDAQRQFLAGLDTADERRIYDEMGQPDKIETVRYPDHEEVTWWYFAAGQSYRFRSGTLASKVPFTPVRPLGESALPSASTADVPDGAGAKP